MFISSNVLNYNADQLLFFQEMKESHDLEGSLVRNKESKMDDTQSGVDKKISRRDSESYLVHSAKARHKGHHKHLARTQSSPLVTFTMLSQNQDVGPVKYTFTTGR